MVTNKCIFIIDVCDDAGRNNCILFPSKNISFYACLLVILLTNLFATGNFWSVTADPLPRDLSFLHFQILTRFPTFSVYASLYVRGDFPCSRTFHHACRTCLCCRYRNEIDPCNVNFCLNPQSSSHYSHLTYALTNSGQYARLLLSYRY